MPFGWDNLWFNRRAKPVSCALVAAKKADLVPCISILPYAEGYCTPFSFIVVQECNAA